MDLNYDYCVVGSGPAGAFAAHELALAGCNVIVIDAGVNKVDMNPENFVDIKNSDIIGKTDFGFSRQVGGASTLWAGGLAKYDKVDFLVRPEFGMNGWLISYNELEKYYQLVNDYLKISVDNERLNFKKVIELDYREMRVLDEPFFTGDLLKHPNITLLPNSSVIRLLTNELNNNVEAIEIFNRETRKSNILKSRCFVIAAGTISNVRILLNSFNPILLNCYKAIGSYVSTHPKAEIGYIRLFEKISTNHPLIVSMKYDTYLSRYQFGLSEEILIKNKLLNHCVRFDSVVINRAMRLFELLKINLSKIPSFYRLSESFAKILFNIGFHLFRIIDTNTYKRGAKNILAVRGFFDQRARIENRITLSSNLSSDGLPLAKIDWNYDEKDWKNVEDFMKNFSEILVKRKIGEFVFNKPEEGRLIGVHSHFIGGTRMGENLQTSVVDKNLKVHGLNNLFISGPSVFPSYGFANPFYTIAAMSIRLGQYLSTR